MSQFPPSAKGQKVTCFQRQNKSMSPDLRSEGSLHEAPSKRRIAQSLPQSFGTDGPAIKSSITGIMKQSKPPPIRAMAVSQVI